MADPTVSVTLLAHNGARFVAEAVESILGQTHRDLELIVIDDGSTDDTPAILSRFRDPRMRLFRQPNLGIGFARNRAVAMATGDYVASMSHDDVSLPDRLAIQLEEMRKRDLDICFSWARIIDAHGQPAKHFLQDTFNQRGPNSKHLLTKLQRGNFLLAPSVVCRRECYHHFASNVVLLGLQDYALWLQMLQRFRARVIKVPLVQYRLHDGNVSFRFRSAFRQLEVLASLRLANDPPFSALDHRQDRARDLLAEARRLIAGPDTLVDAYLAANRAVNLDPTEPIGYETLARTLSLLGHHEPAQLVHAIGERVHPAMAYPLPLLAPRLRDRERRPVGWWRSRCCPRRS